MISVFEKVRLQQLRMAKYSILASILHIFEKKFFQNLITTCAIHYVNLVIFLYLVLNLDTFFKNFDFLEIFILSFFFEEDLLLI